MESDSHLGLAFAIARSQARNHDENAERKIERLNDEILRLREEIGKMKADAVVAVAPSLLCKCYTDCFQQVGDVGMNNVGISLDGNSISRYLESVRVLNGRKKRRVGEEVRENEDQEVARIADFIIELASSMNGRLLTVWIHQAVEFVKSSVSCLVNNNSLVPAHGILKKLIANLTEKVITFDAMKTPDLAKVDYRPCIVKVLLQLAEVPFIGHKVAVDVTTQLAALSETLAHADPFTSSQLLENVYFLLELLSELLDKPFSSWVRSNTLDAKMLESFISAFFQMKSSMLGTPLSLLFVSFTDRICSQLIKQLHAVGGQGDEELHSVTAAALQRLLELAARELPTST